MNRKQTKEFNLVLNSFNSAHTPMSETDVAVYGISCNINTSVEKVRRYLPVLLDLKYIEQAEGGYKITDKGKAIVINGGHKETGKTNWNLIGAIIAILGILVTVVGLLK